MRNWAVLAALVIGWTIGVARCGMAVAADAGSAATQPGASGPGDELLQNKAALPGYGEEAYRIVSEPDEIVSVLRNGAVVICKHVVSPAAAVRGYVHTGGVYEGHWLGGGLSHLLEHLVAGGSSERRTEAENKALLQKIGNDSNAYTTYDHTAFFVNTTTPHFAEAADLVTGWMLGAKITPAEYRREYQVVQRELERNKGNPDMVFWQLVQDNRYQVSPARVPVIGYQEVIQGLTRDDVYNYYKMAYQPNNMIFAVASSLSPEQMLAVMQKNLDDAKPGREFSRDIAPEPPVMAPRTLVATFPRLGQAKVQIAFPSVTQSDPDMYPLDLLAQVMGGGESSILTEDIRDQQQLCSAIECDDDTPTYVSGSFEVAMDLDPENIEKAKAAVLAELEKVKSNGIDGQRLARAKVEIRMARLKSMQTAQDVAASMGTDFLSTGDVHYGDEYVDRIEAVTAAQVQDAARRYLDTQKLLTTVLLPREAVGAGGLARAEDLLRAESAATQPSAQPSVASVSSGAITKTVLNNGLIVLHRRITTSPLVQIDMFATGGITAETADTNGLGNLAMAMLRRGTQTRSAEQIADFFDLTGGELQATCGNNTWYWKVSCTRDQFDKTMDVFGDVVNHPAFAPDQLERIKSRVEAQIEGQDASWDGQAFRFFKQAYFKPLGSPYQFDATGTAADVRKFSDAQVRQWYEGKILTAPRVLAIFGDIDNAAAVAMAQKYFGGGSKLPAPPAAPPPVVAGPATQPASEPTVQIDRVQVQKTEQAVAGVVIGFESDSQVGEPEGPALTVAQCLAGGYSYPTGYIFEILRGQGLVYEAGAFNSPGRGFGYPGTFITYGACDPRNVDQVAETIIQSIARLQGTPQDIQVDWFDRCKDMITTGEALETQTPEEQATQAATDELFGLGYDYGAGFEKRIDAVTLGQVQDVARTRLRRCVVTICTPLPERVKIGAGERTYASFPTVDLTPRGVQHDVGGR